MPIFIQIKKITNFHNSDLELNLQENIRYISCFTLVDITATGVSKISKKQHNDQIRKLRNQQRNWETLLQAVSFRAQPIYLETPLTSKIQHNSHWCFGSGYSVPAKIWLFVFGVEHADVFQDNTDPLGGLKHDLNNVPVIVNLDETVTFYQPVFCTQGTYKNTHFLPISADFSQKV